MGITLKEYAERLGIGASNKSKTSISPINIEAGKAGYEKYLADLEAAKAVKASEKENETWIEKLGRYLGSGVSDTSNPLNQGFNQAVDAYRNDNSYMRPKEDWTDNERWAFGEKYAKNQDEAFKYAEDLNNQHAIAKKEESAERIAKWASQSPTNAIFGSAASVINNAVLGGVGYLDALAQTTARGKVAQHDVLMPHEISNAIQGGVANKLNEYGTIDSSVPIFGGKGLGDVYGLGMSIAQSTFSGVTGGGAGALVQFFGMSASQGYSDAISRGANAKQALAFGTVSGIAEAIPEMISVKSLLGISSAEGVQNLFKSVLKQAGEEAKEEFTTAVITEVADRWIMGGKSQYSLTVQELMAQGMSLEEAEKKAFTQTIESIAFDTISGALSGGISGAGAVGVNKINQQYLQGKANAAAKEALTPVENELIAEGKKYDNTAKRAATLEKKLASGKELSGYELRMLQSQASEESRASKVDTVRKAIVERMKGEGLSASQAKSLGEIALNKALGNEVSKLQEGLLKRNSAAMKVYNQIDAKNMATGLTDSAWVKETPINELRVKVKAEATQTETTKTEQEANIERLKADILGRKGTPEYKINAASLEGKFDIVEGNKVKFSKTSETSKIHTEDISSSLTREDIAELSAIEKIANELGVDIYVYETKLNKDGSRTFVDKNGKRTSDSGYYDPNDKSIHIDLRAGQDGEGTMLYTASHELVHFVKDVSAEHFDALEKLVTSELIKGGYSIDKLIDVQRQKASENGQNLTEAELREEMVAEACMSFLASKNAVAEIKSLKSENRGLWNAIKKFFTSLFTKINKIYKTVPPDSVEGQYLASMRNSVKSIRDAFLEGAVEAGKKANVKTTEKTTVKEVKSKARSISKITAEMTDAERYEILKDKKITAPYYSGEVDNLIAEELEGKINNAAKKAVVEIAEKIGILKKDIIVKDLNVDVRVSKSSLRESIDKKATPEQLAKLLPLIVPAAEEAVLIERHHNRYYYDTDTVYFDNLISGYVDNDVFVPIRFGLKHSGSGQTRLYVIVDQNRINLDKIKNSTGHQAAAPDNSGASKSSLRATYSIADIIPFVKNKDLLRYLPDEMLDDEQHKAKWESIAETIKKTDKKNDKRYVEYITNGDERSARQMVKAAAKANGYTDVVYHGTKAFGFTEFDTEKSDDKRSLFAAGSTELAQTYSGKHGTKKLSDNKNIDGLSNEEVVKMLNAETAESYEGAEMQTEYEIMTLKDVNNLINEVNDGIDDLQKVLEGKIKEYADKMARDFDDKDAKTHSRLIEANELLKAYEYKRLSTPLYMLLHYTDALESNPEVAELEYKIRLMNKLTDTDTSNGVVVKKDLGGYGVTVLTFDKAREELKGLVSSGNYALYGKPGRQLVIDAKGQNWNNIKNWIQSAYHSTNDTYVKKDDMYYRLYDSNTNEQIFHGRIEITDKNKDMSIDSIHPIMVQKANNVLAIRSEYMKTTRDIAKFAKDEGYDSIKFENLIDNGGAGESVEAGDVYVYFNPSDLKSADTITYDENDKIIPLSERFNEKSKDIRHKARAASPAPTPYVSPTVGSIVTNIPSGYEYTAKDKIQSGIIASQIAFTNAQAGIESIGKKKYGIENIDALVQAARVASNQAEEMIGGNQYRIGADTKDYLGEGLQKIIKPIQDKGKEYENAFYDYLFHQHNADRMSLERRSLEWNEQKKNELKDTVAKAKALREEELTLTREKTKWAYKKSKKAKAERERIEARLNEIKREMVANAKAQKKLKEEIALFTPLKNKAVIGLNHDEIEAKKAEISQQIKDLTAEKRKLGNRPDGQKLKEINDQIASLTKERSELTAEISEEKSREIISEYEKNYSDFAEVANKVWNFNKNLNQYRVDTGLISQSQFDYLQKLYPHYVPTYRSDSKKGIAAVKGKNNLAVNQSIKRATGSTKDLLNPIVIMSRQVMETVRAGRINAIAEALYDGATAKNDKTYLTEMSRDKVNTSELIDLDPTELRPKENQVTFFKNGEKLTLQVSSELFAGFNAFAPTFDIKNPLVMAATKANKAFKVLVTSANPVFLIRNAVRDIQDAGLNTKFGVKNFTKNYVRAITEISKNSNLWELYRAMGGSNVSYFDFDKGFKKAQSKHGFEAGWRKVISNANAFVECLPRFAEFISSIEAGNTAEQAMLDAADVTTNFARTGTITKKLNSTIIPFLNPAIQGASKAVRNITGIRSIKEAAIIAAKATLIGIAPFVLNSLLYNDDEDYKDLREEDKENNYVFKIGDVFLKIPRGRMASVIAGATNRTIKSFSGEDADWKGYLKNASTQMNPLENMARTIFSPFMDVANNTTWYGSAIEGREFENKSPAQRFDESTSSIAIAMGKLLNYSPKKIHYLLDQYSGVIGDFALPATTKKAERDFLSGNFTIDPVTSNKLSDQFYDMYYEAQYAKSDDPDDKIAEYQVKHLNRVKYAISKLFDEKDKIQNSDLSDKEKLAQTRAIQILINEAYKTAVNDFELITNAIKATAKVDDQYRYAEITRLVYGAEKALEVYDEKVYETSKLIKKTGISYDNFYKYYFGIKDIKSDKDKNGNTISGSKKTKVIERIDALNIPEEKKLLLIAYSGYTLNSEKEEEKLLKYINNLKLSTKSKEKLADMLDFEYKNGKIVAKTRKN